MNIAMGQQVCRILANALHANVRVCLYVCCKRYGVATISRLLKNDRSLWQKKPYKRDDILQKRPMTLRSELIAATTYQPQGPRKCAACQAVGFYVHVCRCVKRGTSGRMLANTLHVSQALQVWRREGGRQRSMHQAPHNRRTPRTPPDGWCMPLHPFAQR